MPDAGGAIDALAGADGEGAWAAIDRMPPISADLLQMAASSFFEWVPCIDGVEKLIVQAVDCSPGC